MKELARLMDGDANAAQRSLLEAAQAHRPPDDQARARTLAALAAVTGGVAAGSAAAVAGAGASAKSLGTGAALARAFSPAILKWCAIVSVGSGVSAGAVLVVRHEIVSKTTNVVAAVGASTARPATKTFGALPVSTVDVATRDQGLRPDPVAAADSPALPAAVPSVAFAPAAALPATSLSTSLPPASPGAPAGLVAPISTDLHAGVSNAPRSPASPASPASPVERPTTTATPSGASGASGTSDGSITPVATAVAEPPSPSSVASLSPEVRMLDEVRARLSSHDPANALAALNRYTAAFPAGVFLPEARVLRIEALLLAGDRTSATRLADDLLRGDPNGPYAQRVRKMIQK